MRATLAVLFAAGAIFAVPPTEAAVIYNNGAPDTFNGHHSDFDQSNGSDTVLLGDDFTLGTAAVIRSVHWFGIYAFTNVPPALDNFTIRLYAFSSSTPNTLAFAVIPVGNTARTDTGVNVSALDIYRYDVSIADIPLAAGRYFLSIVNNTAGTKSDWYWANSSPSGNAFERDVDTAAWMPFNNTVELAFSLNDSPLETTPEPATLTVWCGLGLAGVIGSRRRKQT